jgi:hypothetical protein
MQTWSRPEREARVKCLILRRKLSQRRALSYTISNSHGALGMQIIRSGSFDMVEAERKRVEFELIEKCAVEEFFFFALPLGGDRTRHTFAATNGDC